MKKLLLVPLVLVLLLLIAGTALVVSGTIAPSSIRMALNVIFGVAGPSVTEKTVSQRYQLPYGFKLSLYAKDLPGSRFLRFTAAGDLLVSRPHKGDIMILRDTDNNGTVDIKEPLIEGLNRPQGMDFKDDWLYIAEREQVGRIRFDADSGKTVGDYEAIITGLTGNGNHWSKTLRFGPDGMLYLSQGSTCNVCVEEDDRRATMMRFNADGSGGEIFATGLRNSAGFDWSPFDGGLYATDNGRDLLGDDFPPCELNLVEQDHFYGWPYFNGDNTPDPDMGQDPQAGQRSPVAPVHGFRAHNAPLGMSFIDTGNWPQGYEKTALIALHGSWNRSSPDGYKVVSLHFTDSGITEQDFLSGFYNGDDISGRPVDVAQGPDGAIYVSDDYGVAVYLVSLNGGNQN